MSSSLHLRTLHTTCQCTKLVAIHWRLLQLQEVHHITSTIQGLREMVCWNRFLVFLRSKDLDMVLRLKQSCILWSHVETPPFPWPCCPGKSCFFFAACTLHLLTVRDRTTPMSCIIADQTYLNVHCNLIYTCRKQRAIGYRLLFQNTVCQNHSKWRP